MSNNKSGGKLLLNTTNDLDSDWERVLDEINIESLPIRYLTTLKLNLKNNDKFIIDVKSIVQNSPNLDHAAHQVNSIIKQYKNIIVSIDFQINVTELVDSVTQAKNAFTKKVNFNLKRQGRGSRKRLKKKDDDES